MAPLGAERNGVPRELARSAAICGAAPCVGHILVGFGRIAFSFLLDNAIDLCVSTVLLELLILGRQFDLLEIRFLEVNACALVALARARPA